MKNFLIVDDHSIVREGLTAMLSRNYPLCHISEACDGAAALASLKLCRYQLVILDVHLPDLGVFTILRHLREDYPQTKVLMFSMTDEVNYGTRFAEAGANGFVSKTAASDDLALAISKVLEDPDYYSADLVNVVSKKFGHTTANPFNRLSPNEFEVGVLLVRGRDQLEISGIMGVSVSTIGTYRSRMLKKLGLDNLSQLADLAAKYGIIQ